MKRNRKGFTLIELLIVVAIIGIIVAIAIPNLLNAIQRAKQKRTMGDERTCATAAEAYAVDLNRYPPAAGYTLPGGLTVPSTTLGTNFSVYVAPTYIARVPMADGWGSWFLYGTDANFQHYLFISNGKDGSPQGTLNGGPSTNFNDDVIFGDGQFLQFPEGIQQ
jgi:general secretion pathway protein G